MATATLDPHAHHSFGYADPVVRIHSRQFPAALVKLAVWLGLAVAAPVGAGILLFIGLDWLNAYPEVARRVMSHGTGFAAFFVGTLALAMIAAAVAAIGMMASFFGAISAFSEPMADEGRDDEARSP